MTRPYNKCIRGFISVPRNNDHHWIGCHDCKLCRSFCGVLNFKTVAKISPALFLIRYGEDHITPTYEFLTNVSLSIFIFSEEKAAFPVTVSWMNVASKA